MKNMQASLLLLLFFNLASCEKHADTPSFIDQLEGNWKLVEVTGGFSGEGYTPAFDALLFAGNRYTLEVEEETVSEGTFRYEESRDYGLQFSPDIAGSAAVAFEQEDKSVDIDESGRLWLADPCCDLFVYQFTRSK